jgi:hypothetical protein
LSAWSWRASLALVSVLVVVCAAFAGTAGAAFHHPARAGLFGPDGGEGTTFANPQQLAINQSTNTLYVQGNSEEKIYGYSIPNAATHTPVGGAFPIKAAEGGGDPDLAVDSASGNIYYVSEGTNTLYGFQSNGASLASPWPISLAGDNCGAAVNGEGDVGEANYQGPSVNVYEPNGTLKQTISLSATGQPCHIEFNRATDDLYVANYGGGVFKYTAASGYTAHTEITAESTRGLAVDASTGTLYVASSEKIVAYNASGAVLETFATGSPGTEALRGIAVDEASGVVYVVNQNGGKVLVYPGVIVPDVTTGEPISNDEISGTVDPAGGGEVISCRVEFGETTGYGEFAPCSPAPPYSTTTNVTATLPGLIGEHSYHYRVLASNANGTNVGNDATITPHYVKALHTDAASGITRNCATLNGSFEGNGEDTHYFFEYGKTTSYESTSATPPGVDAGSPTTPQTLNFELCGLEPGTTYHYRITASNALGSSTANDQSFKTITAVEFLTSEPAVVDNASEATLHGSYLGNGEDTSYSFEWGFSSFYGNHTPEIDEGTKTGTIPVAARITGLFPGTIYHFRVVARNATGYAYGEDLTFTTGLLPEVGFLPPLEAKELPDGSREVTLRGTVNPKGGEATTWSFQYGLTTGYGASTAVQGPLPTDELAHPVNAPIGGLIAGDFYHYRLVATSKQGTTYGPDKTVQAIPNLPTVNGSSVSEITTSGGTVNASVRPGNGSTTVIVDYGQTADYGSSTLAGGPIGSDEADHTVSRLLAGLQPNTTYHYRVSAINFAGTTNGPDQTFTTAGLPSILSQGVTGVGGTAATLEANVSANLLSTTYHFEYGPKGSFATSTGESGSIGADREGHTATARITGLAPGATYQFRVVATNSVGTTAGAVATFTTSAPPAAKAPKCKKGQVLRKGKCVKKATKKPKKKHKKHKKAQIPKQRAGKGGGKK